MNNKKEIIPFPVCGGNGICYKCRDFVKCKTMSDTWRLYHLENKELNWEIRKND